MIQIDYRVTGIARLKVSEMNDVVRDSLHELAEFWHAEMLPKHFTIAGAKEYGYTPRKGETGSGIPFKRSYSERKVRYKRHRRPLVFSGDSERQARSARRIEARATQVKAHVTISLPIAFNRRHPKSNVRMQDEIRAVSDQDLSTLGRKFVDIVSRRLHAAGEGRGAANATIQRIGV